MNNYPRATTMLVAVVAALAGASAQAQEAQTDQLQEVVVAAQFRSHMILARLDSPACEVCHD